MNYWLLKTEPSTYSFSQLLKDKKTNWNGVRNFQARNNLRKIQKGDVALIYHSGDDKAVVGISRVIKEAYPDIDKENAGDWVQVDLEPAGELKQQVTLSEIKATKELSDIPLIRQSRLSVMPISKKHFDVICALGKTKF